MNPAPLISEAVRGAGAILVDRDGRRFALDTDPRGELAPRDVVARAVAAADAAGGAWLDARSVSEFSTRFPGITAMLAGTRPRRGDGSPAGGAGAPLRDGWDQDRPGGAVQHARALGGGRGRVHRRARRQPSRLELTPRGSRLRRSRGPLGHGCDPDSPFPLPVLPDVPALHDDGADAECEAIRREMRSIMTADVGVQRTESSLLHAEQELETTDASKRRPGRGAPPTSSWSPRLITQAARKRRESRGGHRRADYPPAALKRESA